tara:strand:- start:149 stop:460 length:312 start_codon:yes stop_codon:yes gene_type:complete
MNVTQKLYHLVFVGMVNVYVWMMTKGESIMNIISLIITFVQLNSGQTVQGKKVLKEGMDVIKALGDALKDKKITKAEKKVIVKELKEFSTSSIKLIDSIVIPE